jgi:prephenate dehydrogenase
MRKGDILVLGAAGAVGKLLVDTLVLEGFSVTGLDRELQFSAHGFTPIHDDVRTVDWQPLVQDVSCVVVCLPEDVALEAIRKVAPFLPKGSLLVDTLSVKAQVFAAMKAPRSFEWLGINPLFAPDLGLSGQRVAAVGITGLRSEWFLGVLRERGAHILHMTTQEHDRASARAQALTHAALLSFGGALHKLDYKAADAAFLTPPYRALLALLARILTNEHLVYWDVQAGNPEAGRARASLATAAREFEELIGAGNPDTFAQHLQGLRAMMGPELDRFSAEAAKLLRAQAAIPVHD